MIKLSELASIVGGSVKGNADTEVVGFCSLELPRPGHIAFLEKGKDGALLTGVRLAAVVTNEALSQYYPDAIIVENPKLAFIGIIDKFQDLYGRPPAKSGIHESAVVDATAEIAASAYIMPNAVISAGVTVGEHSIIGAGAYLGRNSTVGDNCFIHANVSIYRDVNIGNHVEIHSGTAIGCDGFGFVPTREGHRKFPQVGRVIIEDNVEIGANCCIDRAALDATVIRSGSKLDNLVQIAHGVEIGSNTVIAAQTGISGGTQIGNWCVIGGQAGFQGHISVGDQSIIAAQSGVFSDIPYKSKVSGYPAKPHSQSLKVLALTFKLPELVDKVKSLEIEIELMRGELQRLNREKRVGVHEGEDDSDLPPGGGIA